jgi:hypothetical protein
MLNRAHPGTARLASDLDSGVAVKVAGTSLLQDPPTPSPDLPLPSQSQD